MSDRVCVDTVFVCRSEADRSVYMCVCGDSFGMKGFLLSYGNWFTISFSLLWPSCSSRSCVPLVLLYCASPPPIIHPSACASSGNLCVLYSSVCTLQCRTHSFKYSTVRFLWVCCVCTCDSVCMCVRVSGWSQWSLGTVDQHISSSSKLRTRKPKVPSSLFCFFSKHWVYYLFPSFTFRRLPVSLNSNQPTTERL